MEKGARAPSPTDQGVEFVQNLRRDIRTLQETLTAGLLELRTGLQTELDAREAGVGALHTRVSDLAQRVAVETELRKHIKERADTFEQRTKRWVAALGYGSKVVKDRLNSLDESTTTITTRQASLETRAGVLEADIAVRASQLALDKLSSQVALQAADAERDRRAATDDLREVKQDISRGLQAADERTLALRAKLEEHERAASAELASLGGRCSSLDSQVSLRATMAKFDALESFTRIEVNGKIELLSAQVAADRKNSEQRDESLGAYGKALATKTQADIEEMKADLTKRTGQVKQSVEQWEQTLSTEVAKFNRRVQTESEATSASMRALEKELGVVKVTTDSIAPVFSTWKTETLPTMRRDLNAMPSPEEWKRMQERSSSLEVSMASKGDLTVATQQGATLAEHAARSAALEARSTELERRLEAARTQAQDLTLKFEAVDKKVEGHHDDLVLKAYKTEVADRKELDVTLADFYKKSEVDALFCRVWWRVGDMQKTGALSAR